jgi:hypothetical protein
MNRLTIMPKRRFGDSSEMMYGGAGITRTAINNNRARSLGPPNTLSQRLLAQKFGGNPFAMMNAPSRYALGSSGGGRAGGSPTIRGWQNYTGKTMGEVGQYSRIPGFGRAFRG